MGTDREKLRQKAIEAALRKGHESFVQKPTDQIANEIKSGNRTTLSRAITLVESSREVDQRKAESIINAVLPNSGNSIRLGITGVPGVGKSTFIESFGLHCISKGYKVAVLAVDPSSSVSRGSILGDKTRMNELSRHESAYVRPSAAGNNLGGVARKTREAMLLCEAAGYDYIIVETVGVGQSETTVRDMVDCFLLLMLSGAGDELQGIKRGVMEMADVLVINKADGDNLLKAKRARAEYARALHLFPPRKSGWIPESAYCSALEQDGIDDVFDLVEKYERHHKLNGFWEENRSFQLMNWFDEALKSTVMDRFYAEEKYQLRLAEAKEKIMQQKLSPFAAVREIFR
jgi:LAO/AO transport system kinase